MANFMELMNAFLDSVNGVIWHDWVLYIVMGTGLLFTFWSGFCQYRALTHGVQVTRGAYDRKGDPGAINHFQALSAALSATVGLGNIGGVAVAVGLGGPGAVFWMWMVGLVGMALKTTEVTLSMLYRNTHDPDNPHGGPMFVAQKAFKEMGMPKVGRAVGSIFVVTLLISAITGGNMFQAWNVAEVTYNASGGAIPRVIVGIVLAVIVGLVIIGGIKRIGNVAGRLVPLMVAIYLLAALYVLAMNVDKLPAMFVLIIRHAFAPAESGGAFVGAAFGLAFSWGLQRALFSSEAGQGSSPIAHSAAKTDEPVREGVVAGLEPFIDTIVVCTLTALVILSSGAWNRPFEAPFEQSPEFTQVGETEAGVPLWSIGAPISESANGFDTTSELPAKTREAIDISGDWAAGQGIFVVVRREVLDEVSASQLARLQGQVRLVQGATPEEDHLVADWYAIESPSAPTIDDDQMGVYRDYVAAALTTHAFDRVTPGLGTWLVLLASWLFALSTQISWSYYGEQGVVFLFGDRGVMSYKFIYCLLAMVSCLGFIKTDTELNNLTNLGTGVMLWANIPIMLLFGVTAMRAYSTYMRRLDAGEFHPHRLPPITDVVEGKDVRNGPNNDDTNDSK